jgi:hypothetical protein
VEGEGNILGRKGGKWNKKKRRDGAENLFGESW